MCRKIFHNLSKNQYFKFDEHNSILHTVGTSFSMEKDFVGKHGIRKALPREK